MALTLRNRFGQLDISVIDPVEVAKLDDGQQTKVATLVAAIEHREIAYERYVAAVRARRDAEVEQTSALEAHKIASEPFQFVPPKAANYGTKDQFDAAMILAREQHDLRVREHRQAEARATSIAAYNASL
ncbi:hypothetical protein [Bradyrhizobium sp. 27S5]|uniref:hypothetical protein n=1 Tax=Bradyrhizobium sp. 27S5 TaxID=3139728 RepID=UPI0030D53FF3